MRHMGGCVFLLLTYSKQLDSATADRAVCLAHGQMRYALGEGGRSFVVGFGQNPPQNVHHRAASCPPAPQVRTCMPWPCVLLQCFGVLRCGAARRCATIASSRCRLPTRTSCMARWLEARTLPTSTGACVAACWHTGRMSSSTHGARVLLQGRPDGRARQRSRDRLQRRGHGCERLP